MKTLFIKTSLDRSELDLVLRLRQQGVDVRVLTDYDSPGRAQLEAEGIYIRPYPYKSKISPGFIRQLRTLIDAEKFELIHAIDSKSLANVIWASYFRSIKIVGYRGTLAKVRRHDPSYWLALLHPRVDRVVCINQSIYDYMREFFPAEKLLLNYKGYDVEWGEEAARQNITPPPLPENAFVVCYIANTLGRPYKGLEILVQAMHLLTEQNIHLLFIGDYEAATLKLAQQGPAATRIHFIGVDPTAASYLRYAHVFVLPSLRDGLPRVMKEAMAQSVAVITTNIIGPKELVIDGESGLWVEPGKPEAIAAAITKLYRDPQLRARLGAAGKERLMKNFSSVGFVDKTLALYRELLEPNGDTKAPQ